MHYYVRNIGDYMKKAARLSLIEHGAYNLLMDCIYDREQFPTRQEAIDWLCLSNPAEIRALDRVLRLFFTQEDDRFYQKRIDEELEIYRQKADIARENGRKGGRPKNPAGSQPDPSRIPSLSRGKANQYPLTNEPSNPVVPASPAPARKKTMLADDYRLSPEDAEKALAYWLKKGRSDIDLDEQFERFCAHHRAAGSRMMDWSSAWVTWYSRAPQFTIKRSMRSKPLADDLSDTSWADSPPLGEWPPQLTHDLPHED